MGRERGEREGRIEEGWVERCRWREAGERWRGEGERGERVGEGREGRGEWRR